jgi:hypothetical protein
MKNLIRSVVLSLTLVAACAYAVPSVNVTVSDSSGKAAFKGATNAKGTFATPKLKPGNYAVQFNGASGMKGNYAIVVSAGSKKVSATGVAGEKFAKGGVALKVDVAAGLNIAGQIAAEDKSSAPMGSNGKPMVWIAKQLGSNIAAHWAESDSAEAKEAQTAGSFSTKNIQDRQNQSKSPGQ